MKDSKLPLAFGQEDRPVPGVTAEYLRGPDLFAPAERPAVAWQNGEHVEVLTTGGRGQ